ncbi:MAG TPA: carboxypeptidase regulatory-like domain-containing protein [Terriglobales bacterium]|nr:carboxypeptidase regulatory-like domain-containing protein [Terriglobales bacterium]
MQVSRTIYSVLILLLAGVLSIPAVGQSLVSGDIAGTITDPSGAVVPNATVTLKNNGTGQTQTSTTNSSGAYRFSLLPPAQYTVSATASGFQNVEKPVTVAVGQATQLNLQLAVGGSSQTVEVTAEGAIVQTENGNISTTFTPEQVELVPNPGNDLSYIVQAAPGAVMNTQAGYGNSAMFGLPATSNLFTVNGMNENDPFLNLNNSGATNLLLGQNDVQEVSVVNNGYSAQYGGLAGANVNYVTKSGTNNWHGSVNYFWNGRAMNANSWFDKQAQISSGLPNRAPFDNANQWSASVGGPIIKNKTFFFVDYEGLRVLLPTSTLVQIPSPQYQAATLANIGATAPGQLPFYQNMFNLWTSAPGAANAGPIPGGSDGCDGTISLGAGVPCAVAFRSTAGNFTHESLLTARVDQNISDSDHIYGHFRSDHGLQATYTDPINSVFNAQSDQPQYEGQLNETHIFSSNATNQFILAGSWYSAIFKPANMSAATALMPYRLRFSGGTFYDLGRDLNDWPQGRNVTQYQIIDDFSKVIGKHNIKVGMNFRRNDITDYSPGLFTTGEVIGEDQASFFSGTAGLFTQAFNTRSTQPIALYGLGLYAQDEWTVKPTLRVTLGLRAEHDSNPVCQTNCFARLTTDFMAASHDPSQPYNQAIRTGIHQALPSYTGIGWEPRLGFAWTPRGAGTNTVLRGGIGIFHDFFPATVADSFLNNPPLYNQFFVGPGNVAPGAGSVQSIAAAANSAFVSGFASGGTVASISGSNPFFVPPSLFNSARSIHAPQYQEWNLELQQGFGQKTSLSVNYVGNHQIYGPLQNGGLNAFCDVTCLGELGATTTQFSDLPGAAPDPRFGTITQISSSNVGNYNGVTLSLQRRFSALQFQANYTYSHALDIVSNAGILPYNFNTNESTLNPQDPFNYKRYNYGNADYDVRHTASLNYVWTTPKLKGWVGAIASWTVSGTAFWRTGLPVTAYDDNASSILNGFNYGISAGDPVFANQLNSGPVVCTSAAVISSCLNSTTQFSPAINGWGNQRRNQVWGPHYFDTDLSVTKNFHLPISEASNLGIGLQFFNILNHPNFDQPDANISSSTFGQIISTVSVPTSILGSFLGGDASPRLIQVKATLSF